MGSKKPKVIVRPQRALLNLGAPSAFHGRHSEHRAGFVSGFGRHPPARASVRARAALMPGPDDREVTATPASRLLARRKAPVSAMREKRHRLTRPWVPRRRSKSPSNAGWLISGARCRSSGGRGLRLGSSGPSRGSGRTRIRDRTPRTSARGGHAPRWSRRERGLGERRSQSESWCPGSP